MKAKKEQFEKHLKVDLTDEELLAFGREMAEEDQGVAELESQLAATKKELQGKIDVKASRIGVLANLIRQRFELRPIKCVRVFNYEDDEVTEYRNDSGDVISTRAMTLSERQQELALGGEA